MEKYIADISILPAPQKQLWPELVQVPDYFTLYGGTAIALQLGHRKSIDFDFFTNVNFKPSELLDVIHFLNNSTIIRAEANTLTCRIDLGGAVQVSFFGGLSLAHINEPLICQENSIRLASLADLVATKLKVIQDRASYKDYYDLYTIFTRTTISLSDALDYAGRIYGSRFNPLITIKALTYFDDEDLYRLTDEEKTFLRKLVENCEYMHKTL